MVMNPEMKHHKWSSAEFGEECALIYTHDDKSKHSIFRLSIKPERVLLRLANSFCDSHPNRSLRIEIAAQKDNFSCFNFQAVKVVTNNDTYQHNGSNVCDTSSLRDLCGKKSCFYEIMQKVGNTSSVEEKVSWEFCHWYNVSDETHIAYNVVIECDKVKGLSADFRGPFKCTSLLKALQPKASSSLILHEENTKPAKDMRKFVEGEFEGKEYTLFHGASHQRATLLNNITNTGARFEGDGNGSKYQNCHIVMNTYFNSSSPSP